MMLHLYSKSSENYALKKTVTKCVSRLDSLEAKCGGSEEPAIPLSLAVRFLPLPAPNQTELEAVKAALLEIRAPGVDCDCDCVKAVRLGDTSQDRLGTVIVEMRNQECKAQIMKNKKNLEGHPSQILQKLIIKNAQTKSEIKMSIALSEILKKIPGEQNSYISGSGHIMTKNQPHPPRQGHAAPGPPQHGHQLPRQQHHRQQPQMQQLQPAYPPLQPRPSNPPQQPQQPFQFPNFNFQGYPYYPPPYAMPGMPPQGFPQPGMFPPNNPYAQPQPLPTTLPNPAAPAPPADQPEATQPTDQTQSSSQDTEGFLFEDDPVMETDQVTNQNQENIFSPADQSEAPH